MDWRDANLCHSMARAIRSRRRSPMQDVRTNTGVAENPIHRRAPSLATSRPVTGRLRTQRGLRHLLEAAAASPARIVFVQGDGSEREVSYGRVLARATARLAMLRAEGLCAGSRAVLLAGDNEQFVVSFWACIL